MKPAAYLVDLPTGTHPQHSVFLDCAKAVDYAAQHHGSVGPLVRASDAAKLQAKIDALTKLVTTSHENKDDFIARVRAIITNTP